MDMAHRSDEEEMCPRAMLKCALPRLLTLQDNASLAFSSHHEQPISWDTIFSTVSIVYVRTKSHFYQHQVC